MLREHSLLFLETLSSLPTFCTVHPCFPLSSQLLIQLFLSAFSPSTLHCFCVSLMIIFPCRLLWTRMKGIVMESTSYYRNNLSVSFSINPIYLNFSVSLALWGALSLLKERTSPTKQARNKYFCKEEDLKISHKTCWATGSLFGKESLLLYRVLCCFSYWKH